MTAGRQIELNLGRAGRDTRGDRALMMRLLHRIVTEHAIGHEFEHEVRHRVVGLNADGGMPLARSSTTR